MQAIILRIISILLIVPYLVYASPVMPERSEMLEVTCVKVVDGDTAWFEEASGLVVHKVRFIGIDTPETVHPTKSLEPYGKEASEFTEDSLFGNIAWLEYDIEPHDHYDRHLCYVWLEDGSMFNLTLVQQGYARASAYKPNIKYKQAFDLAEIEAKEAKIGLWGLCAENIL